MSSQETLTSACSPAQGPHQPSAASSQRTGEGPGEADPPCPGLAPPQRERQGVCKLTWEPRSQSLQPKTSQASYHDLLVGSGEERAVGGC